MALRTMTLFVAGVTYEGRDEAVRRFASEGGRARVERDADNPADRNAIAVILATPIDGQDEPNWTLIGYVAADRAALVAPLVDQGYFQNLSFVLRVEFREGQRLPPLLLLDLTYTVDEGRPDAEMRAAKSSHLVAELGHLRWEDIEATKVGDPVALWLHPDGDRIHAYRRGSVGGQGFLGSATNRRLIKHISNALPYQAFIHRAGSRAWVAVRIGR